VKVPDVVVTRYWIAIRDFQRQTNYDCQNISMLVGRYAAPCKALIQNPEAVLKSHLKRARQTVERLNEYKPPPTAVLPKSSSTTTPEPGAASQESEDINQHPTTGTKKGLSSGKRLNPNAKSAVGNIFKTYADKLTAYLGLDPAATESARTTALAKLAAALADASKKPLSAEDVSAINKRLAEQDPALATALASAAPTLNQSIADTASALCCANGARTGSN
jgi:hypothetical protein